MHKCSAEPCNAERPRDLYVHASNIWPRSDADRLHRNAIDVDDEQLLAQQFNVRSMPTFVLVRDGTEIATPRIITRYLRRAAWNARLGAGVELQIEVCT